MQVTETLSAGLKREYKVVVNQAELDQELNAKLVDMSKRANIKGFRPGKVPVHHLKRGYGKSARGEVVQNTTDSRTKALLEEKKLKPANQPEVKLPEDRAEFSRWFKIPLGGSDRYPAGKLFLSMSTGPCRWFSQSLKIE